MNEDLSTLICLFHNHDEALATREDVVASGVSEADVSLIAREEPGSSSSLSLLYGLDLPAPELHHLLNRLERGDVALTVRPTRELEARVEAVFEYHEAGLVGESGAELEEQNSDPQRGASIDRGEDPGVVVPILREEIQIGKRTVTGGARVFQRVVKVPVGEQVSLRDENVRVERRPVDRAATSEEESLAGEHVIELTETREHLVVGKTARVVEEIVVGREVSERVEHITDTLRHTEVEVEQIAPERSGTGRDRIASSSEVAGRP